MAPTKSLLTPALAGLVAGVLLTAAMPASAASSRSSGGPSTSLTGGTCTTSLDDPQQRAVVFRLRTARGAATTYGYTADLQEKAPKGRWTTLSGSAAPAGFGSFQAAAGGASAMARRITVRGLRMGSAYRLRVSFRWDGPTGRRTVVRRSSACTVKDLRPNLGIVSLLDWRLGTSGDQVIYRAKLRVSRTALIGARAVTVSVHQGSIQLGSAVATRVRHGAIVLVAGTRCAAGEPVTVRVDAAPTLDERKLDDNALTVRCPGAPGAPGARR